MLCPTCIRWGREASQTLEEHHPNCPFHPGNLCGLVGRLVAGISRWAADEDGVPSWLWDDYQAARALLGKEATR